MESLLDQKEKSNLNDKNLFRKKRPEISYKFDYEINEVNVKMEKEELCAYDKETNTKLTFDSIIDKNNHINPDGPAMSGSNVKFSANFIKRLVSKKKHRIQNEFFDLDMAYITERVLAMGYPSTGCESLYRNSMVDIKRFLDKYHKNYKIYNLCMEEGRIYRKEEFIRICNEGNTTTNNNDNEIINGGNSIQINNNSKSNNTSPSVAIFPFMDHDPCPIKLILEFCVDIFLYLYRHPNSIAAVHCKAGKGRTGTMIISYLLFCGFYQNVEGAVNYYARQRTVNGRGVTIPSQIRYIKYFETYLHMNFTKPYYKMIPRIIKNVIVDKCENILRNYLYEDDYFFTNNFFSLKEIKIGPFVKERDFDIKLSSLPYSKLDFKNMKISYKIDNKNFKNYLHIDFNSNNSINYDIELNVSAFKFKFYFWINLYYSTIENISNYIVKNGLLYDDKNNIDIKNIGKGFSNLIKHINKMEQLNKNNDNNILNSNNIIDNKKGNINTNNINKIDNIDNIDNINTNNINNIDNNKNININININNSNIIINNINNDKNINNINTDNILRDKIDNIKNDLKSSNNIDNIDNVENKKNQTKTSNNKKPENSHSILSLLLSQFRTTKDIPKFLNSVNKLATERGITPIDSERMIINIRRNELDKFCDWFGDADKEDFKVEIIYGVDKG